MKQAKSEGRQISLVAPCRKLIMPRLWYEIRFGNALIMKYRHEQNIKQISMGRWLHRMSHFSDISSKIHSTVTCVVRNVWKRPGIEWTNTLSWICLNETHNALRKLSNLIHLPFKKWDSWVKGCTPVISQKQGPKQSERACRWNVARFHSLYSKGYLLRYHSSSMLFPSQDLLPRTCRCNQDLAVTGGARLLRRIYVEPVLAKWYDWSVPLRIAPHFLPSASTFTIDRRRARCKHFGTYHHPNCIINIHADTRDWNSTNFFTFRAAKSHDFQDNDNA